MPPRCLLVVLRHTLPVLVRDTHIELGEPVSLLRFFAKPPHSLSVVREPLAIAQIVSPTRCCRSAPSRRPRVQIDERVGRGKVEEHGQGDHDLDALLHHLAEVDLAVTVRIAGSCPAQGPAEQPDPPRMIFTCGLIRQPEGQLDRAQLSNVIRPLAGCEVAYHGVQQRRADDHAESDTHGHPDEERREAVLRVKILDPTTWYPDPEAARAQHAGAV